MAPRWRSALAVVVGAAVAARVAAALYLGGDVVALPGTADQISYHALALRVAGGHGFTFDRPWWPATAAGAPTAHWSYLYTVALAGLYWLVGPHAVVARLIQAAAVGIAQSLLTFHLARRLFGSTAALAAALIVAAYAYFVYYAAALMTEAFYIVAVLATILAAMRLRDAGRDGRRMAPAAVNLGAAIGIASLLRQEFLLVAPLVLAWVLVTAPRPRRWSAGAVAVAAAVVAGLIAPWTAYNYVRFDRFVLLNTNAGFAFFWANHPIYGSRFQSILPPEYGTYQDLVPAELRGLDEVALDRALLRRGIGFVIQDPGRYLRLSASRVVPYFKFWPDPASARVSNVARVASFGLTLPLLVAGVVVAARQGIGADAALILAVAAAITAIHLLSWALIRYRLPVDAVMMPFAGLAVSTAVVEARRR